MNKTPIPKQHKGEGSYYACFNRNIGDISETRWRDLIEDQDFDALIIEIREDLLALVAEVCHKKHIKGQVCKFLVGCTHKAFRQIVPLHFYTYDGSHKLAANQASWTTDDEPPVSKPDSWSKGNIPFNATNIPKNKYQQTYPVSSEYNLIKCGRYPSSNLFTDTFSNKYESDDGETVTCSGSFVDVSETDEPELVSSNMHFSNYNLVPSQEILPSIQDQHNRVVPENTFYRRMKANRTSSINLQSSAKGKKCISPPWTNIDEITVEMKAHAFTTHRAIAPAFVSKQTTEDC